MNIGDRWHDSQAAMSCTHSQSSQKASVVVPSSVLMGAIDRVVIDL